MGALSKREYLKKLFFFLVGFLLFNKDDIDPTSIGLIGACFKNASWGWWFNAGSEELLETDLAVVFELLLTSESAEDFFFRLDTGALELFWFPFETNFLIRVVKLSAEELGLVEFVLEEFLLEEVEVDPVLDFLLNLKYFLPFCDDFLALLIILQSALKLKKKCTKLVLFKRKYIFLKKSILFVR